MFSIVRIGNQDVPMKATASVDLRFKQVFRIDPFVLQTSADYGTGAQLAFLQQMGFVMASAAKLTPQQMGQLTEADFLNWLDEFDRADLIQALPAIKAVYEGNYQTTATPKNEPGEQPEK